MRPVPGAALTMLLVMAMATRPAQAETASAVPQATPSYRWQIATADGVAAAFLYTTYLMVDRRAYSGDQVVLAAGLGTYLMGGPLIHVAHHQGTRAALSFVARAFLPYLGAEIGKPYRPAGLANDEESNKGLIVGAVVGMTVASLADVLVIARPGEQGTANLQPGSSASPRPGTSGVAAEALTFAPGAIVLPDRAMVGFGGIF